MMAEEERSLASMAGRIYADAEARRLKAAEREAERTRLAEAAGMAGRPVDESKTASRKAGKALSGPAGKRNEPPPSPTTPASEKSPGEPANAKESIPDMSGRAGADPPLEEWRERVHRASSLVDEAEALMLAAQEAVGAARAGFKAAREQYLRAVSELRDAIANRADRQLGLPFPDVGEPGRTLRLRPPAGESVEVPVEDVVDEAESYVSEDDGF